MHVRGYEITRRHTQEPLAELTPALLESYRDHLLKTSARRWSLTIVLTALAALAASIALVMALDVTGSAALIGLVSFVALEELGSAVALALSRKLPRWDGWVRLRAAWDRQRGNAAPISWIQVVESEHERPVDVQLTLTGGAPALTWLVGPVHHAPIARRVLTSREAFRDASRHALLRASLRAQGRIRLDDACLPLFDLTRSPDAPDRLLALRCRASAHRDAETITFTFSRPGWLPDHQLDRIPVQERSGVHLDTEDASRLLHALAEVGAALGRPIRGVRLDWA